MRRNSIVIIIVAVVVILLVWWLGPVKVSAPINEVPVSRVGHESVNTVSISNPLPGEVISSPLLLEGQASGAWFFEGSAPVTLTDWDGLIIAEGYVTATGDWMTTDIVPFTGTLEFTTPIYGDRGNLIFRRANASDLFEHDAALELPVYFTDAN